MVHVVFGEDGGDDDHHDGVDDGDHDHDVGHTRANLPYYLNSVPRQVSPRRSLMTLLIQIMCSVWTDLQQSVSSS